MRQQQNKPQHYLQRETASLVEQNLQFAKSVYSRPGPRLFGPSIIWTLNYPGHQNSWVYMNCLLYLSQTTISLIWSIHLYPIQRGRIMEGPLCCTFPGILADTFTSKRRYFPIKAEIYHFQRLVGGGGEGRGGEGGGVQDWKDCPYGGGIFADSPSPV